MRLLHLIPLAIGVSAMGQATPPPTKQQASHAATARNGDRMTMRDGNGRITGTASTSSSQTQWRDANGRLSATSTASSGRTVWRDANGKATATSTTTQTRGGK